MKRRTKRTTKTTITHTPFPRDLHQNDDVLEDHAQDIDDDSFISTVDFNGVDFGPIIKDIRLIRRNGRIRASDGTYFSVDSNFSFTPNEI
jgi:hypothetical protein